MRIAAGVCVLIASLLLASCGATEATTKDAVALASGLDAYKAGDREALHAAMKLIEDAHPPSDAPAPCSPAFFAQRTGEYARIMLGALDKSAVFSMNPEARLVYFDAVFMGGRPNFKGPMPTALTVDVEQVCKDKPDYGPLQMQSTAAQIAMLRSYADRRQDWYKELEVKYGSNLPQRMTGAAKLLRANHLDAGWTAGG